MDQSVQAVCNKSAGGGNVNFKGFANHVYRLPHEQYGYRGHVTNLLQDIASFANSSFTFTILAKPRPTMPCIFLVDNTKESPAHDGGPVLARGDQFWQLKVVCWDQIFPAKIPQDHFWGVA